MDRLHGNCETFRFELDKPFINIYLIYFKLNNSGDIEGKSKKKENL